MIIYKRFEGEMSLTIITTIQYCTYIHDPTNIKTISMILVLLVHHCNILNTLV